MAFLAIISCSKENHSGQTDYSGGNVFEFRDIESRWSSFENITAEKGRGGAENFGAKGHP